MFKSNSMKNVSEKMNRNHFKFSIRRLSVGTASVLLGIGITGIIGTTSVLADGVTDTSTTEITDTKEKDINTADEDTVTETPVVTSEENTVTEEPTTSNEEQDPSIAVPELARQARSVDAVIGNNLNQMINTDSDKGPVIEHGVSITTDPTDTTMNGDRAIFDLSKGQDGRFYAHYVLKNNSDTDEYMESVVYLPSAWNKDTGKVIVPHLDTTLEDIKNLSYGLENEEIDYSIKGGDYHPLDEVNDGKNFFTSANVNNISYFRFFGTLKAHTEKHLYIPIKVDNFNALVDAGKKDKGTYQFWARVDNYTSKTPQGTIDIEKTNTYWFIGAVTKPDTDMMDKINESIEKGLPPYILDIAGNKFTSSKAEGLDNIKITKADITYSNPYNDNTDALYIGGTATLNLENIKKQLEDTGYSVLTYSKTPKLDADGNVVKGADGKVIMEDKTGVWPEYAYRYVDGTWKWFVAKPGEDATAALADVDGGGLPFFVQKVFDAKDEKDLKYKVDTTKDTIDWKPEDGLNSAKIKNLEDETTNLQDEVDLKPDTDYKYEVTDKLGTKVTDDNGTFTLGVGEYTVTYSYILDDGTVISKTTKLTVKEKMTDESHNIKDGSADKRPDGNIEVIGKGNPGDKVTVTDKNGTEVGTTTVGPDGNIKVTIPADKGVNKGDEITLTPVDPDDNSKGNDTKVTVEDHKITDGKADKKPNGTVEVTGKGNPGDKVTVTDKNGTEVGTGTVDTQGNITVTLPSDKNVNEGDKITLTPNNDKDNKVDVTVEGHITNPDHNITDGKADKKPDGTIDVTGKGKPGDKVEITNKDGNNLVDTEVTVDPDGNIKVTIPADKNVNEGDKITLTPVDPADNSKGNPTEVTVTAPGNPGGGGGDVVNPITPPNGGGTVTPPTEENTDRLPESGTEIDKQTDSQSGNKGNGATGNAQGQNSGEKLSDKSSAAQLPKTGENESKSAILTALGLAALALASIVGVFSFKKKEN